MLAPTDSVAFRRGAHTSLAAMLKALVVCLWLVVAYTSAIEDGTTSAPQRVREWASKDDVVEGEASMHRLQQQPQQQQQQQQQFDTRSDSTSLENASIHEPSVRVYSSYTHTQTHTHTLMLDSYSSTKLTHTNTTHACLQ